MWKCESTRAWAFAPSSAGEPGSGHQPDDGIRHGPHVVRLHQNAAGTQFRAVLVDQHVLDQLLHAADAGADRGEPDGHRLEHDDGLPLVVPRKQQSIGTSRTAP